MKRSTAWWAATGLAAGLLVGCGGEGDGREASGGPGIGSITNSGTASAGGTDDSATGASGATSAGSATGGSGMADSSGGDDAPLFDLPPPPIYDLPVDEGCRKVDFLFTIDNSGSMGGDQANLVANFPAFINGIQNVLETVDEYQVGVVTTDTYDFNIGNCQALSALVVQTGGDDSSNQLCGPFADGFNFMTEADDLATSFNCAAQVGTDGSGSERQMQATVEAVQKVEGDPGECNEGFIRDDALLVIVIITDESDSDSPGNPMQWYDDVVAAKDGVAENVVVLSLINTPGGMCGADTAFGISEFTDMFGENGFQADVCTMDCDNFMPPG